MYERGMRLSGERRYSQKWGKASCRYLKTVERKRPGGRASLYTCWTFSCIRRDSSSFQPFEILLPHYVITRGLGNSRPLQSLLHLSLLHCVYQIHLYFRERELCICAIENEVSTTEAIIHHQDYRLTGGYRRYWNTRKKTSTTK